MNNDFSDYDRTNLFSRKKAAILSLAILMTAACLMPLGTANETDALEPTDYKVSTPGYFTGDDGAIDIAIGNGHSRTVTVYVQNYTSSILDVAFYTIDGTRDVHGETIENLTLMPAGDAQNRDLIKQPFTISVKDVTASHKDARVALNIFITNLEDDSYSIHTIKFNVDVVSSFDTSGSFNKFLGIIDNTLPEPFDNPIVPFIVTLAIFFIIALLVIKLCVPALSGMLNETTSDKDRKRFKTLLTLGVMIATIALFIDPGLKILGADINWIYLVNKISMTLLVVTLALTIWKVYMIVVESMLTKLGKMDDSKIDLSLMPLFAMFGKLFLWIGGAAAILHIFDMDLSGILISAGIVTLGITLGAQSVLSQFFSGIILLLTRPFSKGDYVLINDVTHIVKDVKLMYTEFLGDEKDRIITMPNNAVASATIVNMSKYDKAYRLYINFQIPYDVDIKKAEEIVLQIAEENEHVLHDYNRYKRPVVKLIEFQDAGIELRLDVTIRDFAKKPTIQSDLKKELYVKLAENGIEAPYNRLDVRILDNVPEDNGTA